MYRLIYLMLISVLFTYCSGDQGDQQATAEVSGTEAPVSQNVVSQNGEAVSANTPTHAQASHEAPYCKLWVIKFAAEVEKQEDYKGRWFNLKCDNTFESGQWEKTMNKGQWKIEEESNILNLYFNDPTDFPARWQIQGAGGGGRILWKGNIPGNEPGYQLMIEPEETLPVKS